MRILGIDPGLALVGYGILEVNGNSYKALDYGVISTKAHTPTPDRLKHIYLCMNEILDKFQPDEVAFEELFFNKNAKTVINVGQARGVEILTCRIKNLKIYEYTPLQIKQAMTGYGRADKNQIQEMVKRVLNLEEIPKPDDAADALAVAITHASGFKFRDMFLMG